jgi:lipoate-protein ligase A
MELFSLGKVPWLESQLIYHALANLGRESLVLLSPASPYVCIGYHQDVSQEVDMDFCKENNIPVFRREVGGGAVYLDGFQLFYQLILREGNPAIPARKEAFYKKFLQPVINVYHRIGIPVQYKPINDIVVESRKIAGTGVGEIGDCVVFVGNIILDFNYEMMTRILKVPDEKFRDKVRKTLEDNLTTIRREVGDRVAKEWNEGRLNALMAEEFEKVLEKPISGEKDALLIAEMEKLSSRMTSDAWLYRKRQYAAKRSIRIRSGVVVKHQMHKAPGGLMRADFEVEDDQLQRVSISGDFFSYPRDAVIQLESRLEGKATEDIHKVAESFCSRQDIEMPGITLQDWIKLLEV